MNRATISGDIISSSVIPQPEKRILEEKIRNLLIELTILYSKEKFFGRLIKGDYLECAMEDPSISLRIALIIKTLIKSSKFKKMENTIKSRYFREHGIRIALAVDELETLDPEKGIIDGKAIYLSGRALQKQETSGKEKIVIKSTFFFVTEKAELTEKYEPIILLLDVLLSKYTSRQSEIIYYKLFGKSESEIAKMLNVSQSAINQHSTAAGWIAIEKAVKYFENNVQ